MGSVGSSLNWSPVRKSRNYSISLESAYVGSSGPYAADYRYRPAGGGDWYIDRVYMNNGREAYDRVDADGSRMLYSDLSGAVNQTFDRRIEQRRNRVQQVGR